MKPPITTALTLHYRIIKNLVRMAMSTEPVRFEGWKHASENDFWTASLKDSGMICTVWGRGYKLAKPASSITLNDVDKLASQGCTDVEIGDSPIDLAIAQAMRFPDITIQDLVLGQVADVWGRAAEKSATPSEFAPHYLQIQNSLQMVMHAKPNRVTQHRRTLKPHFTPTFRRHYLVSKNLVQMALSTKPVPIQGWGMWGRCARENWAAKLKREGLINGFKGRERGYMLAVPASEITLTRVDELVLRQRHASRMVVGESPIDLAIVQALRLPDVTIQDLANSASTPVGEP